MLSYGERAKLCNNPTAKQLFTLIEKKQTNLALSADLNKADELLSLVDLVGPEICVLKTHIDIVDDFSQEFITQLTKLSKQHQFIIFEDRKFADIGNTVKSQYSHGVYHIADWAAIINAHTLPGPGIIEGLKQVGLAKGNALLLIAELSSKDNLITQQYTEHTIELAKKHNDFVIGFISQHKLTDDPSFIHMTPGIKLAEKKDSLGQQYNTPDTAIQQHGTDVIIVGRGIYASNNPLEAAQQYRHAAWQSYCTMITS